MTSVLPRTLITTRGDRGDTDRVRNPSNGIALAHGKPSIAPIRATHFGQEPSVVVTEVNVPLELEPIELTAVMQTATSNANMTPYSTAVGPSSFARKYLTFRNKSRMANSSFKVDTICRYVTLEVAERPAVNCRGRRRGECPVRSRKHETQRRSHVPEDLQKIGAIGGSAETRIREPIRRSFSLRE